MDFEQFLQLFYGFACFSYEHIDLIIQVNEENVLSS